MTNVLVLVLAMTLLPGCGSCGERNDPAGEGPEGTAIRPNVRWDGGGRRLHRVHHRLLDGAVPAVADGSAP